ncbi:MAG: LD-carboxypeptidase [Bacteroidia bacterium]
MSLYPPFLTKGDKIAIVATARKTNPEELQTFIKMAGEQGFEVVYTPELFSEERQFAGTDEHRANNFQHWLDDDGVKAILLARGGYGTARMIDGLDFSSFIKDPKWLIGFSDFTVIHSQVNCRYNLPTLHAAMPAFLKPDSLPDVVTSFKEMFEVLKGNIPTYQLPKHPLNKSGNCSGTLVGGNLSVIYSIMGSVSEIDTNDAILFLEDLDEYLYHIDRMMVCLKRAGKLNTLKGLIVGHMNDMHDRGTPFGKTAEEIIEEHTEDLGIPLYFNFDAGHKRMNHPLIFGTKVKIESNCLIFGNS